MTSCRQGWEARFTPAQITLATLMRHQPPHHCTRHRHIALTPHSKHMVRKLQALLCFTLVGCQREDAGCFALVLVRMLGAFSLMVVMVKMLTVLCLLVVMVRIQGVLPFWLT